VPRYIIAKLGLDQRADSLAGTTLCCALALAFYYYSPRAV